MIFNIPNGIPEEWNHSFKDFEQKFSQTLSSKYPILQNKIIDICFLDPDIDFFKFDKNNPVQTNIEEDRIEYSANSINLSSDQREALIAHEIGHIINKGKFEDDKQQLEIECDKIAVELCLAGSLKEALIILKEIYSKDLKLPLIGIINNECISADLDKISQRIEKL